MANGTGGLSTMERKEMTFYLCNKCGEGINIDDSTLLSDFNPSCNEKGCVGNYRRCPIV